MGFLANHSASNPGYQTFLRTLRELGYVEGKNIAIEARYAEDNFDRLPELARELVHLNVDLLFVSGDQGVSCQQATDTIPNSKLSPAIRSKAWWSASRDPAVK